MVSPRPAPVCRRVVEPLPHEPHRRWTGDSDANVPVDVSVHVSLCAYVCIWYAYILCVSNCVLCRMYRRVIVFVRAWHRLRRPRARAPGLQ